MKRASYREGVAWVAENDSAGDATALHDTSGEELITAVMLADLFQVPVDRVAADVIRYRKQKMGME